VLSCVHLISAVSYAITFVIDVLRLKRSKIEEHAIVTDLANFYGAKGICKITDTRSGKMSIM